MAIDLGDDYSTTNNVNTVNYVPGDGPLPCDFAMVGEAPAKNEIRLGIPFCGAAGKYLSHISRRAQLPLRDFTYITNLIKVPAIDNEEEWQMEKQIKEWEWMLHAELDMARPKVVASLGAWSTRWFIRNYSPGYPNSTDLDWLHGIPRVARAPWGEFLLVPCFHPAAGLHDSDSIPKIYADLVAVRETINGQRRPPSDTLTRRYYWCDSDEWLCVPNLPTTYIAIDTEGWPGRVNLMSFSWVQGEGWVVRDQQSFKRFMRWLQGFRGKVVMHNAPWDLRVEESVGLDIARLPFTVLCTMQLAKYLNTEPGGLKALAWRHMGVEMNEYMDIIRPVQKRFTIDYLSMAGCVEYPKPEPELEFKAGLWKVKKPQGLNQRINRILLDLGKNPDLDVVERWGKVPEKIQQMAVERFGPMPVATLDHVDPELARHYSGQDADTTLGLYWKLRERYGEVYG